MERLVRRKLDSFVARDPLGRGASEDPWSGFREVEILDFRLSFQFRHSLGKASRFFLGLEERRLLATRCPDCKMVWLPPRPICGNDLAITEWVELSGRGVLVAGTVSAYTLDKAGLESRLAFGYVALDGASTLLFQQIRNVDEDGLVAGLPLRVAWGDTAVDHPMQLFWFEPA